MRAVVCDTGGFRCTQNNNSHPATVSILWPRSGDCCKSLSDVLILASRREGALTHSLSCGARMPSLRARFEGETHKYDTCKELAKQGLVGIVSYTYVSCLVTYDLCLHVLCLYVLCLMSYVLHLRSRLSNGRSTRAFSCGACVPSLHTRLC